MAAWFSNWFGTEYYKLLYGHRDLSEALPLVRSILLNTGLPIGSKVWDMACGRGRHLKWFEEAGMVVHGSDLSEASIAEAEGNLKSAIMRVHDMRDDPPFSDMDLTVNLFTSLGYFDSIEDDGRILGNAFASLKEGGFFVLDYMNIDHIREKLVPESWKEVGDVRFGITRSIENGMVVKRIEVKHGSDIFHFQEQVRAYQLEELLDLLRKAGFASLKTFGKDMLGSPEESERVVILAQKS